MFEKYIVIKDSKLLFGMNASTGAWYCKELPANTVSEGDVLIGSVNAMLNRRNKGVGKKPTPAKPQVRM